jgi:outer membrane protein assembly factor BamB
MRRYILAGVICVFGTALVVNPGLGRAQSGSPWPTFQGGSSRNGVSSASGPRAQTAANKYQLSGAITDSAAINSAGVAFVGDDAGNVYELDPANAAGPTWTFKAGARVVDTPTLSPDGSKLYVGADNGNIYALSTSNGSVLWQKGLEGPVQSSPLLSGDGSIVYVATSNGNIHALNTNDGSQRWKAALSVSVSGSLALSPDGAIIYASTANQAVYGIPSAGLASGNTVTPYSLDGDPAGSPALDANGNIYVATNQGTLYSFTPGSNTPRWHHPISPLSPALTTPTIWNGLVLYGANNGNLYAVSQDNGNQVWATHLGAAISDAASVTSGNGTIYVGSNDGNIYALDGSGHIIWSRQLGVAVIASPSIAPDGSVWVGAQGGTEYRFHEQQVPPTPVNVTSTPGPSPTPSPTKSTVATLKISLKPAKVHPGKREVVTISGPASTAVSITIHFPNGNTKSGKATTNASGGGTFSFVQNASQVTHSKTTATVTAKALGQTATGKYTILLAAIDTSAEPRTQKVGKAVNIWVHAKARARISVLLMFPNKKTKSLSGKAGKKGWLHLKYKVAKHLTKGKNHTVTIRASTKGLHPNVTTTTTFKIK